jgi:hypothetical protein
MYTVTCRPPSYLKVSVTSVPAMDNDIITACLSVASASVVGAEASGFFVTDPVAIAESAEAGLEVEGEPTGQ